LLGRTHRIPDHALSTKEQDIESWADLKNISIRGATMRWSPAEPFGEDTGSQNAGGNVVQYIAQEGTNFFPST
jgi:mono/diheme cytochrome c family protein